MPENPKKSLSVCLIGCGEMGRLHASSIVDHPLLGELSVCDWSQDAAQKAADDFGATLKTVDAALDSSGIDAYIIASPAHLHLDHTARAAKTGAYVFCEKPLGVTLASINEALPELIQFADKIQMGFNRRFDQHMAALKARLDLGEIGEIEQLHIVSRDHKPPLLADLKNSAGLIGETAIHDFDTVRWLMGVEIAQVSCFGATLVDPLYREAGIIDTATTILTTKKGQQIVIQNSLRAVYGYDQRVEAFGADGRLNVSNPTGPLVSHEDRNGLRHGQIADDWSDRYVDAYRDEMHQFLKCVANQAVVSPGLQDGVMASQLAHLAQLSLDSGQPQVCEPNFLRSK